MTAIRECVPITGNSAIPVLDPLPRNRFLFISLMLSYTDKKCGSANPQKKSTHTLYAKLDGLGYASCDDSG